MWQSFAHFLVIYVLAVIVGSTNGKYSEISRILGGKDVEISQVPYTVSLVHYGEHICGGAIIKEDIILITAHCLTDNINLRRLKVRSGTSYRTSGTLTSVKKFLLHESYNETDHQNDIAVVWLDKPLNYSDTVHNVELPELGVNPTGGSVAKLSGWGYLSGHGPLSYHLKVADIPIVDHKVCEDLYYGRVHKNMICAGYSDGGVDACNFDSGAPLVSDGLLFGMASWGVVCGAPGYPGVYVNVAYFRPWIHVVTAGIF